MDVLFMLNLTPKVPNISGLRDFDFLQNRLFTHLMRYHTDFGLGIMLKGDGNVPPSSK